MFGTPPPPPPPDDFGPKVLQEAAASVRAPSKKWWMNKMTFWKAIFNPPALESVTEAQLIEGIESGNIVDLNGQDAVVSVSIASQIPGYEEEVVPYQWALRRDYLRLAELILRFSAIERDTPSKRQEAEAIRQRENEEEAALHRQLTLTATAPVHFDVYQWMLEGDGYLKNHVFIDDARFRLFSKII